MSRYKMSEYCEDLTRAALGIEIEEPIPTDVFNAVSEAQHTNDVIDGPRFTREDVEDIIATMEAVKEEVAKPKPTLIPKAKASAKPKATK